MLASDVDWGALNPARGDKGPRAGNLWGDRTGKGTSGFLVKFVDGFSSPPHIHNVTYRGIVISGLVHNDDPAAAEMWMPAGSYWTQPAGEVHITAAKGKDVTVYVEIDSGPYLVLPKEQASDNGERPVNVDASNVVWLDASASTWIQGPDNRAKIAFLWGEPQSGQPTGTHIKLPAGSTTTLDSQGHALRAVVIQGQPAHQQSGAPHTNTLIPGNYFGSDGDTTHQLTSPTESETILYIRTEGRFNVRSASERK